MSHTDTPPIILLTGGISTGKTFASDYLASLGAHVIDTDLIAREVVDPNTKVGKRTLTAIARHLGREALTPEGTLNRVKVRELIFTHPPLKETLEAITHPEILSSVKAALKKPTATYHLVVVPILYQGSPYLELADYKIAIEIARETQIARLMARDKISQILAEKIVAAQISHEERRKLVDEVVYNKTKKETMAHLLALHKKFISRSF